MRRVGGPEPGRISGMELTVLTVPECPHAPLLRDRLAEALAGRDDVRVTWREVAGDAEARGAGMRGSPTLLVDGVDPFATPGAEPSMSCRLYRRPDGGVDGAPSVPDLRAVLE